MGRISISQGKFARGASRERKRDDRACKRLQRTESSRCRRPKAKSQCKSSMAGVFSLPFSSQRPRNFYCSFSSSKEKGKARVGVCSLSLSSTDAHTISLPLLFFPRLSRWILGELLLNEVNWKSFSKERSWSSFPEP